MLLTHVCSSGSEGIAWVTLQCAPYIDSRVEGQVLRTCCVLSSVLVQRGYGRLTAWSHWFMIVHESSTLVSCRSKSGCCATMGNKTSSDGTASEPDGFTAATSTVDAGPLAPSDVPAAELNVNPLTSARTQASAASTGSAGRQSDPTGDVA